MNADPVNAATRARILVAEDSPLNLQVALKQLERLGFAADGATDGAQALAALQRVPYDIILMDCQMPELNGYEATWQIRERERAQAAEPSAKRTYIIAMTANTQTDSSQKCLEAGMDDYISKPVELPQLEAALYRGLAERASTKGREAVVDPVVIAGLRQLRMPGKPGPLNELIDLYLQEAPRQLEQIASAATRNDESSLAQIFRASAALKGSSSNLGARNVAALCDEMEQTVRNWSLADLPPLIDRTREELNRVRSVLEQIKTEEKD